MLDLKVLKSEERAIYSLRSLYEKYGYLPFRVSRFEEYDLYVENKEFLVSDRVITFNDMDGRLLALKPDVTLSILKNTPDTSTSKRKVYYNESVYRPQGTEGRFGEIMQTGLECIGELDVTDIYEAVLLAGKSLSELGRDFVLDVSHMGILSAVIAECAADEGFKREAMSLLSGKSAHGIAELCAESGVSAAATEKLEKLATLSGKPAEVLSVLKEICTTEAEREAYESLSELCLLLCESDVAENVRIDFSVVNNMNYYDGVVFRGFVEGIAAGVLSGGEYGALLRGMGRSARAVGFAIYLNLLSELGEDASDYDVDALIVYGDLTPPSAVVRKKEELIGRGLTVRAERTDTGEIRYREKYEV